MSTAQATALPPTSASPHPAVTTELRARAMQLAALSRSDLRTAVKFLLHGPTAIKVLRVREDLERAARQLGEGESPPANTNATAGDAAPRQSSDGATR